MLYVSFYVYTLSYMNHILIIFFYNLPMNSVTNCSIEGKQTSMLLICSHDMCMNNIGSSNCSHENITFTKNNNVQKACSSEIFTTCVEVVFSCNRNRPSQNIDI